MNSPVAQHLLMTYGARLTMPELARVLRVSLSKVHHDVASGALALRTYKDGQRRYADYRDVAAYLETKREETVK